MNTKIISVITLILVVINILITGMLYMNSNSGASTLKTQNNGVSTNNTVVENKEPLKITVIDDKRCQDCQTDKVVLELKQTDFLQWASYEIMDFSEEGVDKILKENGITFLPAIIFNRNDIDAKIDPFLTKLNDGTYKLEVGAKFDPFEDRSEKGFQIIGKDKLEAIYKDSYIKGNKDAKITWLEYSDLECPYCAKLHNSGTEQFLTKKYGDDLNIIFNHFPLNFHRNAQEAAEILEYVWENKGTKEFYELIEEGFKKYDNNNFDLEGFYDMAESKGLNKEDIKKAIEDKKYSSKVTGQLNTGRDLFDVTGTPWNVLINNETGEYVVISWAYPTASFEQIIDELLK